MNGFILTFFSGLATLIGILPIFFKVKEKDLNKFLVFFLAMSMSVMICVSLFDLLPEGIYNILNEFNYYGLLIIFILYLFTFIVIKLFEKNDNASSIFKLGIISMIALILHNIPEGIITYITLINNPSFGIRVFLAILFHNIPEGISIALPIYIGSNKKSKACLYTFIASLSEPFGALLAYLLSKYITTSILSIILVITAFLMINLSILSIYKEIRLKGEKKMTYLGFIIGIIIIIISSLI